MKLHASLTAGLCSLTAAVSLAGPPGKGHPVDGLRLGPQTTVVTEPLNALGYPDYVAALDARTAAGVAPEENFWTAFCETLPQKTMSDGYFEQLVARPGFEKTATVPLPTWPPAGLKAEQASKVFDQIPSRPWKASEFPEAAAWVKECDRSLARVAEATKRPKSYAPLITMQTLPILPGVLLPHVQESRSAARALSARAYLAIGEGRPDDAWEDVATMLRMARHLNESPFIISNLVGMAINSIAREPAMQALAASRISEDALADRWREIVVLLDDSPKSSRWLEAERFSTLDMALAIRADAVESSELFDSLSELGGTGSNDDPLLHFEMAKARKSLQKLMLNLGDVNDSLAYVNDYHDRLERAFQLQDYQVEKAALDRIEQDFLRGTVSNEVGDVAITFLLDGARGVERAGRSALIRYFSATFSACNNAQTRVIARARLMSAAFAAELAYRRTGSDVRSAEELEQALRQLTDQYGIEAPEARDAHTGGRLHVRRTADHLMIYSVGENGVDNEGKTFGEGEGCDDMVVLLKRVR